jgi:hypothetical protein
MRSFAYLLLCVFFYSCNNESEKIEHPVYDSAAVEGKDSTVIHTDTAIIKSDSVIRPVAPPANKPKSASIAYSYFTAIKRNEVKNINVRLDINNPESVTRTALKAIEKKQLLNSRDADTNFTSTLSIPLYDSVEVTLEDPAGDYTLSRINHTKDKQKVDTVNGNIWGWTVLTKTDKKETRLILKITAYMPSGEEVLDNRSIPIRIQLEQTMLRKLWASLLDDPKYFLTVILVPVIGYLGKKYFDKKKTAKETQT